MGPPATNPPHMTIVAPIITLQEMRFDLITIFPEFFAGPLNHGIVRRAKEAGLVQIHVQDLREFTNDRHRTVDDRPYGGGEGMVLKPGPLLPAATATTISAASRLSTAMVTRSWIPCVPPPMLMFATSKPSA